MLESPPLVPACSVCGSGALAGAALERWVPASQPRRAGGEAPAWGDRPVAGWEEGGAGEGRTGAPGGGFST